jgi:hypothetical protein
MKYNSSLDMKKIFAKKSFSLVGPLAESGELGA